MFALSANVEIGCVVYTLKIRKEPIMDEKLHKIRFDTEKAAKYFTKIIENLYCEKRAVSLE